MNEGDEWSMEVDLRSEEKEKRTLHWFVRGKQQKYFIKGLPERVKFAVCFTSHSLVESNPWTERSGDGALRSVLRRSSGANGAAK